MLGIGLLFMAGILAASLVGLGEVDEDDDSMETDLPEDSAGSHEADHTEVPETEEGASGGSWLQSIVGTDEDDILPDGPRNDAIAGEGGNDLISGYANAYSVMGGTYTFEDLRSDGMDTFHGGEGNDTIGLSNGDQAYGGAGGDTFVVYHDSSVAEPPIIHDFAPAEGDDIRIVVDAADPSHDMFIVDLSRFGAAPLIT